MKATVNEYTGIINSLFQLFCFDFMKRFYSKFRIFLLMLAFGLSSVAFFNALYERLTEVTVDLPQVQSDTPILVYPRNPDFYKTFTVEELVENRDLSLYDSGGEFSNCFNHGFSDCEFRKCEQRQSEARKFIFEHWKEKKRGYIVYECSGIDSVSTTHIFVEPDNNGEWSIVLRSAGDLRDQNIRETRGFSAKHKRAKSEDYPFYIGTKFLIILNENGGEADRF